MIVFEGDFSENAAKSVLDGREMGQKTLLTNLVNRSLLKKSSNYRYSIHLLIRSFLIEHPESQEKRAKAEKLMVAYFLDLCSNSTERSYSKDEMKDNWKVLKREAHNIEQVLKICWKLDTSEISEFWPTAKFINHRADSFTISSKLSSPKVFSKIF